MIRKVLAVSIVALVVSSCGEAPDAGPLPKVPELRIGKRSDASPLAPVFLSSKGLEGLEAITSGRLMQQGPCIYLEWNVEPVLVLWGEGVRMQSDGPGGWTLVFPSGLRAGEGDRIEGAGGGVPTGRPIQVFAEQAVPEECASGQAVQVHSVQRVVPAEPPDPSLPDPPPPPPEVPSFLDQLRSSDLASQGVAATVAGMDDPVAALFVHIVTLQRGNEQASGKPACLSGVDPATLQVVATRVPNVVPAPECRWKDGLVVRRIDDAPAFYARVAMECDGRSRCIAEGAAVSANMGGEGHGYVMRPVPGGWRIERTGLSWIS